MSPSPPNPLVSHSQTTVKFPLSYRISSLNIHSIFVGGVSFFQSKSSQSPLYKCRIGLCELFAVMFKYKHCVILDMKQEKSLAEDKKVQKLLRDIEEAHKDPEFMKALKRFIRLSTHRH